MSWLKGSDTAALFPPLMLTATLGDERTVNELFGWITRCALQSASHRTDYLIDMGTAVMLGGSRTVELIRIAKKVKLIKVVKREGFEYIEVVRDENFLHIRLRAEQDWENQRKRDNGNPRLTAQVRLRDGDGCRWCGVVTYWGTPDQKSARVGTYDHLEPGQAATVATMVVACRGCNSDRQNDREGWARPLLDPPAPPYFGVSSKAYIAKHLGVEVVSSVQRPATADHAPQRPGQRPDNALGDLAASETTPTDTDDLSGPDRSIPADTSPPVSGNVGSGRDGSGRDPGLLGNGFGRDGAGGQPGRRRRSARGKPRREGA